jgi:hypothetical protein
VESFIREAVDPLGSAGPVGVGEEEGAAEALVHSADSKEAAEISAAVEQVDNGELILGVQQFQPII